jgi:hypothetical protein
MRLRAQRETIHRTPETQAARDPAGEVQAFIAFQRAHGNAAATALAARVLAREPAAPAAERPAFGGADSIARYAAAARTVFENWDKYATAEERAQALLALINRELVAGGGEPVWSVALEPLPGERDGEFRSPTWSMVLDADLLAGKQPGAGWADRAGTVAHEARHSEQNMLAARLLAGLERSTEAIMGALSMPARPVETAKRQPLDPESPEADEAERFVDAMTGAGARQSRRVFREMRRAERAYTTAKEALDAATPEDRDRLQAEADAAWQRVHEAVEAYKALPLEADAFVVSRDVERAFREGR